jgi:hypothetical protein
MSDQQMHCSCRHQWLEACQAQLACRWEQPVPAAIPQRRRGSRGSHRSRQIAACWQPQLAGLPNRQLLWLCS